MYWLNVKHERVNWLFQKRCHPIQEIIHAVQVARVSWSTVSVFDRCCILYRKLVRPFQFNPSSIFFALFFAHNFFSCIHPFFTLYSPFFSLSHFHTACFGLYDHKDEFRIHIEIFYLNCMSFCFLVFHAYIFLILFSGKSLRSRSYSHECCFVATWWWWWWWCKS